MGTIIPANQANFTLDELLEIVSGTAKTRGATAAVGVSTDSRRLTPGNIFVALHGESFDGHDHVAGACESGATVIIASRVVQVPQGVSLVLVDDTLKALGALGRAHRRRWASEVEASGRKPVVVAVTGSAGKTTTCRAIRAVLEQSATGAVHGSAGNLNNAIGIPLVLLGLESKHRMAVVEIGTNSPGEIAYGVSLAEPDVAVLTLVSCAHAQGLGSIEGVAQEKGAIFGALSSRGTAVVNLDDDHARAQWERASAGHKLGYGRADAAAVAIVRQRLQGAEAQQLSYRVSGHGSVDATVPLLGDAGAYACAAAVAVDLAVHGDDFDPARTARGLGTIQGEERRLRPRETGAGVLLIDDAYNANPASMADSVRTAALMARQLGRRLLLVLGEMRELGSYSDDEHAKLGRIAQESGAAKLIAVAGAARRTAEAASSLGMTAQFVESSKVAADQVLTTVGRGDIVLIKGSRGVALERVVEALEAQGGVTQ